MQYKKRLKTLQNQLENLSCDALIVDDPTNLFYMTGLELSAGKLLVHPKGAHLFVDNRYTELCEKCSPFPVLLDGAKALEKLLSQPECKSIHILGFNTELTSYGDYVKLQNLIRDVADSGRQLHLLPTGNLLKKQRAVKDAEELTILRDAARLGSEGFDFVCSLLIEGVSEIEIATELEVFWKRKGSKSLAFDPIIAFGSNSSMPHYRAGQNRLQKNTSVLIDIGVNYKHYHSDMTRVVFFGKPHREIIEIHAIVAEAQKKAIDACRPGLLIGDLDDIARHVIASYGYAEKFTHSLGHGIGLEIHEAPAIRNKSPDSEATLEEGMVITIEPGIYLPNIGGVRLEDTIAITRNGYENLTCRPTAFYLNG